MTANHLAFLKQDSATLEQAWQAIERHYGDRACMSAHGECWQYMGSVVNGTTAKHQFRHRQLPSRKGERVVHTLLDSYKEEEYR